MATKDCRRTNLWY